MINTSITLIVKLRLFLLVVLIFILDLIVFEQFEKIEVVDFEV